MNVSAHAAVPNPAKEIDRQLEHNESHLHVEPSDKSADSYIRYRRIFLSMPVEEKREYYNNSTFRSIDTIVRWDADMHRQYFYPAFNEPLINVFDVNPKFNHRLSVIRDDITRLEVDAIVNSASYNLLGGSGLDGCIQLAAGPFLREECSTLKRCLIGDAKITGGYQLPARYVIHTVAPRNELPGSLSLCYTRSLELFEMHYLRTIAFPCIAMNSYPPFLACQIALTAVRAYLHYKANLTDIERIIFCTFSEEDYITYRQWMPHVFPRS